MQHLVEANSLHACRLDDGKQVHGLLKCGLQVDLRAMFSKGGTMEDAVCILRSCREPEEVLLMVILVGFVQNGLERELSRFSSKLCTEAGIKINKNMVSSTVLGAFGISAPFFFFFGKTEEGKVFIKPWIGNSVQNKYDRKYKQEYYRPKHM